MSADAATRGPVVVLGAGFVGAAVCDALSARGHSTVVADLPTHPWLADRDDAATDALIALIDDAGAVAVVNAVGRLRGTDDEMVAANTSFPEWLVGALRGRTIRLVHLGSAAEYGDPGGAEPVAETAPCRPTGIYGTSKHAGSRHVLAARDAGLDAVVARGFNLVSSSLPPASPLAQWLGDVAELPANGGTVEVWEADTVRDYILLSDLAAGVAALADPGVDVPPVVNLCSGVGLRYGDVVAAMIAAAGKDATVASLGQGGIMAVVGDNTMLRDRFGVRPEMSIEVLVEHAGMAPAVTP